MAILVEPKRRFRSGLLLLNIVILTLLPGLARPQTGGAPAFEVASVKPSAPKAERTVIRPYPARFVAANGTLKLLVAFAYGMKGELISGGPAWFDSPAARFDIEATAGHPVSRDDLLLMLQRLLADRFKLVVHQEKKELPVFLLMLGKNGSKLREVAPGDNPQVHFGMSGKNMRLTGQHAPMDRLVAWLGSVSGRTLVLDRTGLTGVYDFQLEWQPEQDSPAEPVNHGILPDLSGASIFTALQEQLGLKLEARKEPVEVLVIDRAERPSEN